VTLTVPSVLPVYQNVQTAEAAVRISQTQKSLQVGQVLYLFVDGINKKSKVTWASSDESVATVEKIKVSSKTTSRGNIKAVGFGNATITATVDGKAYSCKLTVHHADVKNDEVLIYGETFTRYKGNAESYIIPDYVTKIDEMAFQNCDSLNSITIPNGVVTIEEEAFQWCHKLSSITIPDSVKSIGREAFFDCWALSDVKLSKSMTKIEPNTFSECYGLKNITIPSSITKINDDEFENATNLTITGQAGSYAETYAKAHNYTFVSQ
jgi:hypothetical protein